MKYLSDQSAHVFVSLLQNPLRATLELVWPSRQLFAATGKDTQGRNYEREDRQAVVLPVLAGGANYPARGPAATGTPRAPRGGGL